ncbi:DUF2189 domain-containing protein [Thauera linaloolentis]|uniref:DUF2189 domain-containing protein n=1 Tax=Thauera linaloolentis (strain DSM 12138 / JCM 21573 / CCUG 41526 / CIP 105981 / IAM 15112 / NBRC 102519 / 47Lol) TaxID=1123367 RepID=N6Z7V9_THAL4|nr:DUF2189 domain-containing protein [Thauera linaloolentis]ENO90383.1 hypothetical protein C666_01875 [Thauera linaloolentis 47Lol = DSM 12138]MCM8564042.1 DUF2189 domain-containing protein [Thauera linaloolentis]
MDKPFNSLEQHFQLPHVREVDALRPFEWLRMGWNDMRENLGASLAYGVLLAAIGYAILSYAATTPYLFTAAISGFLLIGPVAAAGLYEISRRHERGEPVSLAGSVRGLWRHADGMAYFGAFLAITLIGWERMSAILFALFYGGSLSEVGNFFRDVFLSGNHLSFVAAYMLIGGVLAAVVFSLSAIAIPMMMDRDTDAITAAMTSLRAVGVNLGAMAVWAALIVVLVAAGFATMMIGMTILLPLLGHATWHAYRDMVR